MSFLSRIFPAFINQNFLAEMKDFQNRHEQSNLFDVKVTEYKGASYLIIIDKESRTFDKTITVPGFGQSGMHEGYQSDVHKADTTIIRLKGQNISVYGGNCNDYMPDIAKLTFTKCSELEARDVMDSFKPSGFARGLLPMCGL